MASLNKEEIRNKLHGYISTYEAKIELWEKVTRNTKKDGTDFQNFKQNFDNARIETGIFHERKIVVFGNRIINKRSEWIEDKIDTSLNVEDYSRIFSKHPEESRICRETLLKDYLYLFPDEVMLLIEIQIAIYQERITDYREQLTNLDKAYDKVMQKTKELFDLLENVCNSKGLYKNSLYYALKEKIEKYPY